MIASVEASVALPARLRPTPAQVCDWYERTLRGGGFDVERTGPHQLEFSASAGASHVRMLGGLSGGDLEVVDTAEGFAATLRGRPSLWMVYLNLAALGVFGSTLAIASAGPPWYLLGVAGLGVAGWGWLGTRSALSRFLNTTNEAIADSFSAVPPAAPQIAGPPTTPSQGAMS